MASQRAIKITDAQDEEYFGDIFADERILLDLDPDDLLTDVSSANQDLWDMLKISDEDWIDTQPNGFFMP